MQEPHNQSLLNSDSLKYPCIRIYFIVIWNYSSLEDYRSCVGPFPTLWRLFLKRCTLINKAVLTIWRALSKPPQRRQGPDPRPLWPLKPLDLSSCTDCVKHNLLYWMFLYMYIFDMFVYHIFTTSPLWLAVGLRSLQEQHKSSDTEQQPLFRDCKCIITLPQMREGIFFLHIFKWVSLWFLSCCG